MKLFAFISAFVGLSSGVGLASVLPTKGSQTELSNSRILNRATHRTAHRNVVATNNDHVLFANTTEAISWINQVKPRLQAGMAAKKFDVLPTTDSRYAILQAQVNDLWNGFVTLFPEQTSGLNVPPVILVDSEVENAFVPKYILEDEKIAHTIVVLTGFVDKVGGVQNRDLLVGMFGHELTHSVFKHILTKYQQNISKYYNSKQTELGYLAEDNPALDAKMLQWTSASSFVGDLTYDEFDGLPSVGVANPVLHRVWRDMATQLGDTSAECVAANSAYSKWFAFQVNSAFESRIILEAEQLPAFKQATQALQAAELDCFKNRKVPFIASAARVLGVPESLLTSDPGMIEMASQFDNAPTVHDGLKQLVNEPRAAMKNVESEVNFSELGFFTHEEHADDVSVLVLRSVGEDSLSLAKAFKLFLSPSDLQACEAIIAAGKTPSAGAFSDPHRSLCYRIDHLERLNRSIDFSSLDIKSFADRYVQVSVRP